MHYEEIGVYDFGDKIRILLGKHKGEIATVIHEGGMDNVWVTLENGDKISVFKDCIEPLEEDENNEAVYCECYKDGICLKDNDKCYLKDINDNGLYFDCNKKVF